MEYPYNDEYLVYDYENHRYILTERAVLDKLNTNLVERLNVGGSANKERAVNAFLDEISELVYSQIYDYSSQWEIQQYQIAKVPSARNVIMRAMLKQVDYVLLNGFINQYSGVDMKKGSIMQGFSGKYLAPLSKSILSNNLTETGVPLLYAGKYSMIFKPNYEEENY